MIHALQIFAGGINLMAVGMHIGEGAVLADLASDPALIANSFFGAVLTCAAIVRAVE